jgi:hypothetical protein
MREFDSCIIDSGDNHILVLRDTFSTAVITFNRTQCVETLGDVLVKTHLTYEKNFVVYNQTIGMISSIVEHPEHEVYKTYFDPLNASEQWLVEVEDDLKIYNIDNGTEHIYVTWDEYNSIDGSRKGHVNTCKNNIKSLIQLFTYRRRTCNTI